MDLCRAEFSFDADKLLLTNSHQHHDVCSSAKYLVCASIDDSLAVVVLKNHLQALAAHWKQCLSQTIQAICMVWFPTSVRAIRVSTTTACYDDGRSTFNREFANIEVLNLDETSAYKYRTYTGGRYSTVRRQRASPSTTGGQPTPCYRKKHMNDGLQTLPPPPLMTSQRRPMRSA